MVEFPRKAAVGVQNHFHRHALTDHALTDHALTDHALTDHALTDHAHTDHAHTDHAHTDHAHTDHAHTDRRPHRLREVHATMQSRLGTGGCTDGMDPEPADRPAATTARATGGCGG